ncbi:MAG: hypothetical protein IPG02_15705 [Ignavibacteria bacterium]|nr:hypothetical protein [Ignavibacteria bacterium]
MCVDFMLALCKNISGMQCLQDHSNPFTDTYVGDNVYYKEHPLNMGYKGTEEPRDWITNNVIEYYSLFGYWKKVEKQIYK